MSEHNDLPFVAGETHVQQDTTDLLQGALPEKASNNHRLGRIISKFAMAAACIIPPADLALSDVIAAKEYEIVHEAVNLTSPVSERALQLGILGGLGVVESVALGQVITRNKKVRNAFGDFDAYMDEKHAMMGRVRRGISWTANAPFKALEVIGNGFISIGDRIARSNSRVARTIGKIAVETGQVNVIGTSTVIMQETMADNPPSIRRQVYLGSLITGSWLVAAEGIKQAYRAIPAVRPPLAIVGETYQKLTSMDVTNPLSTPLSTCAITGTVAALAYTGWKIEGFRQHRQDMTDTGQSQAGLADFGQHKGEPQE